MLKLVSNMMEDLENTLSDVFRSVDDRLFTPAEANIYLSADKMPEKAVEVISNDTLAQPKQVAVWGDIAIVSCMAGQSIQFFDIVSSDLVLLNQIEFDDQCVEVEIDGDFLYVTSTNFARFPKERRNYLTIIDLNSMQILSSIETGGNWSKVIKKDPGANNVLVSNWHSHDISVISVLDKKSPKLIQILKPEGGRSQMEAPRGIDFTSNGEVALVTGFYSRNLLELRRVDDVYDFSYISPKLGSSEYSGAPRDIVIINDEYALYSNLGDNTINRWSIKERRVVERVKVGKEPNSIRVLDNKTLAVSCRGSNAIYLLDVNSLNLIGRSSITGEVPTGLAPLNGGFVATDFDSNKIRIFKTLI